MGFTGSGLCVWACSGLRVYCRTQINFGPCVVSMTRCPDAPCQTHCAHRHQFFCENHRLHRCPPSPGIFAFVRVGGERPNPLLINNEGLQRWDEGRSGNPKGESEYKGSLILPTFIPPFEASDNNFVLEQELAQGC